MTVPDFQRARSAAAKQLRESAILEAARVLGAERGIRQVTLTEIAEAVGMHKSALLRYFETREEIFLRLTADGWREWSAALRAELEGLAAPAPAQWAQLAPFRRYVLAKLSRKPEANHDFVPAMREFGLAPQQ